VPKYEYSLRLIPRIINRQTFTNAPDFAEALLPLAEDAEEEISEWASAWEVVSHSMTLTADGEHGVVSVLLRRETR